MRTVPPLQRTFRILMFPLLLWVLGVGILGSPSAQAVDFDENDPLIVESQLQPHTWESGQSGKLVFKLKLPPGYHAYKDQFKLNILEPDGFRFSGFELTPLKKWFDQFSKKDREGIEGQGELRVTLEAPLQFQKNHQHMKVDLTYQACSTSFCLFPITRTLQIPIELKGPFVQDSSANSENSKSSSVAESETMNRGASSGGFFDFFTVENFNRWLNQSRWMALIFAFFAGVLTSFTPCIFPMIPITLAILGQGSEKRSRWQNFSLSLVYVHGIAFTYALLGLAAASSGRLFGASLGHPVVLGSICAVFLVMALSMYGLFELQVPAALRNRYGNGSKKTGYAGAFLSGLFAGLVASPCVGPMLVVILTYVATQKDHVFGFFLLFTFAMGLGLLFLVLGAFTELTRRLPRSGPWMNSMKFVLGSFMLGAFFYYLHFLIPLRWHDGALGVGLVVLASLSGVFDPLKNPHPFQRLKKGFLLSLLIIGLGYLSLGVFDLRPVIFTPYSQTLTSPPSSLWKKYSAENFEKALQEKKPILVDFYADWCVACHELEKKTFSEARVGEFSSNFSLLRFDATKDSEELRGLKEKYGIQGLPTILFFDSQGQWRKDLTLTEFENAVKFLERMKKAAGDSNP